MPSSSAPPAARPGQPRAIAGECVAPSPSTDITVSGMSGAPAACDTGMTSAHAARRVCPRIPRISTPRVRGSLVVAVARRLSSSACVQEEGVEPRSQVRAPLGGALDAAPTPNSQRHLALPWTLRCVSSATAPSGASAERRSSGQLAPRRRGMQRFAEFLLGLDALPQVTDRNPDELTR